MNKKYQIFISSTYTDLIDERKYVQDTIMKMEHFPVGMEIFSASSKKQWNIIKRTIDLSDYYVLIIGYRYGSEIEDGISYTEREFLYAKDQGIPIIAFIKETGLPVKEKDTELSFEKKEKLKKFIEKVKEDREVAWWTTKEDLSNKVLLALHKEFDENERFGWTRNQGLSNETIILENRIEELIRENDKLKVENKKLIIEIEGLNIKLDKMNSTKTEHNNHLLVSKDFLKMTNNGENPREAKKDLKYVDYFIENKE